MFILILFLSFFLLFFSFSYLYGVCTKGGAMESSNPRMGSEH